jgi:hypothetical protein
MTYRSTTFVSLLSLSAGIQRVPVIDDDDLAATGGAAGTAGAGRRA